MINGSNSDVIAKQLEEFSKEVERKMKNMVAGFAREVALAASANTPKGNAPDMLVEDSRYRQYYLDRQDDYGIPIESGYHSGAWQYSEGSMNFTPVIFSASEMSNDVFNEAEASYQLGNSFSIGAVGPGYGALENGSSDQAHNGISEPTFDQIRASNEADLRRYYDAG